jgi:hypothetical protein
VIAFGDAVAVDTTEATVEDPLDRQAGDACPFPPGPPPSTVNTIWFEFTADATPPATAVVSVSEALWNAGVAIVIGAPGSFTGVACGAFRATFNPVADTTYKIMIFDFSEATVPNGGTAVVLLSETPPAPEIALSVDRTGTFDPHRGTATISGYYQCANALFAGINGDVSQAVGRFTIRGFFLFGNLQCDGNVHPWSAEVSATNGSFAGGKALTVTVGFACGIPFCSQTMVQQAVLLRGH